MADTPQGPIASELEKILPSFIEQIADYAIFVLTPEGNVASWNRGAELIKGYKADEILGKHFSVFYPPEDIPTGRWRHELDAAAKDGRFEDNGWRVRKDGSRFWANVVITAYRDESGALRGYTKVTRDVTSLRKSQELFRIAVEWAPNALVMVDEKGRIVLINAQAETLFRYKREELIGRPIEMLVPPRFRSSHPALREEFFRSPKTRPMGAGRDLFGLRSDGTEVPVEIGLNPISTSEGNFVLASIIDITERKRSQQLFRIAVESAPNAMVMVDRDGQIVLVNTQAERLFGYTAKELIGQRIEILVPRRYRAHHPALRSVFFENPQSRPMGAGRDLFGIRKDGSEVPVEIGLNPVSTEQGEFVLASIVDISERKRIEERIRQVNSDLERVVAARTQSLEAALGDMEEFSYTVSHDLRAPLRALEGYARMIELKAKDLATEPKEYLKRIRETAARLDRLTMDVLTFSRIPRQAAKTERVRLQPIVQSVAEQLRAARPEADISIALPLPDVMGHESLVVQCVSNLMTNALAYVPSSRKPAVKVRAWTSPAGFVRFLVEDNGVGIDSAHKDLVFKPFVRLPGTSEQVPGTGIGLAIVKKAVQRMGGVTGFDSRPGQGSAFWFELHGA